MIEYICKAFSVSCCAAGGTECLLVRLFVESKISTRLVIFALLKGASLHYTHIIMMQPDLVPSLLAYVAFIW